jgi:hypothetical protein
MVVPVVALAAAILLMRGQRAHAIALTLVGGRRDRADDWPHLPAIGLADSDAQRRQQQI